MRHRRRLTRLALAAIAAICLLPAGQTIAVAAESPLRPEPAAGKTADTALVNRAIAAVNAQAADRAGKTGKTGKTGETGTKGVAPGSSGLSGVVAADAATAAALLDFGCDVSFSRDIVTIPSDFGAVASNIVFRGNIQCFGGVQFAAVALLVNRTAPFDGLVIWPGAPVAGTTSATSTGFIALAPGYPGAETVETALYVEALAPFGGIWLGCFETPSARVLDCSPPGTDFLAGLYGSRPFDSGKRAGSGPPPPPPGTFNIRAVHSDKCLDVAGVSTADGANVHQWTCIPGATNQRWTLVPQANGTFAIRVGHSNKCLDVSGASQAESANVQQWTCIDGQINQQWSFTPAPGNSFFISAAHSGKCLSVAGASTADGANVDQFTCVQGATHQQWRLTPPI